MDDSGILGRAGKLFASMAWTWTTAMFFSAIVIMLLIMTVWEFAQPTTERRGWLAVRATRGGRLVIGLLGGARVPACWVMGRQQGLWIGSGLPRVLVFGLVLC